MGCRNTHTYKITYIHIYVIYIYKYISGIFGITYGTKIYGICFFCVVLFLRLIKLHFSLSFSPPNAPSSLVQIHGLFFMNSYCMHICTCVHIYISSYNLLSLYNVNIMHVLRVDLLTLSK